MAQIRTPGDLIGGEDVVVGVGVELGLLLLS
jgi:hypothetical protein